MLDILLLGCAGKMGSAVAQLACEDDARFCIRAGVDCRHDEYTALFPVFSKIEEMNIPVDVVVDFSVPEILTDAIAWCSESGTPYVVGTTGISSAQCKVLESASRQIPILQSSNMSLGLYVLNELDLYAQK